jgi:hemolysin III
MSRLSKNDSLIQVKSLSFEEEWEQGLLLGDEWANCLTHALGFCLSIVGLLALLAIPLQEGNSWKVLVFGIYGASLLLLYGASTFYHAAKKPKTKRILRLVDHCAIYLLIAGSYTPFTMLVLDGLWGKAIFSAVWGLAILGIILKTLFKHRFKILSTSVYIFMGWLIIIAAEPMMNSFHSDGLLLLLSGGIFYTGGIVFYAMDKRPFFHAIWHLFVLSGSACHYFAIILFI